MRQAEEAGQRRDSACSRGGFSPRLTPQPVPEVEEPLTTPEFGGDTDVETGTPPFDLESGIEVNVLDFPNSSEYLQELLDGKFEFPVEDEGEIYFLTAETRYNPDEGFITSNKPDPGADRMAERIGGKSRQIFISDPNQKEFDVISDQYIGEAKDGNPQLNQKIRKQAKANFEAARQTGKEVYYEFENPPKQDLVDKLNEYSQRYGVKLTIDVLNP